ncbi:MAG: GNAT family N-acetyltransferase [Gaiellaceae bacterium]
MTLDAAVVTLALHPYRELPTPPGFERVEHSGVLCFFNPYPNAQPVEPLGLAVADMRAAVVTARRAARERGKQLQVWWIAPEDADLGPALEREGLVNEDTPGFEAIENAMVLVQPPVGESGAEIAVSAVENYEDYAASASVVMDAFEFPEAMRVEVAAELPQRWEEYRDPENPGRQYVARIGGEIVGTATATFGATGINLFGGGVLPSAHGRGVYRALTLARWEEAVERGTPALTVQAGRMSMPILSKLGFTKIGEVRIYVDDVGSDDVPLPTGD